MVYIQTYIAILILSLLAIPFLAVKWKGIAALSLVIFNAIWSGYLAFPALLGEKLEYIFPGSIVISLFRVGMKPILLTKSKNGSSSFP